MNEPDTLDKRAIRRSFERAAQTYDAAAVLQREIADRMLERLDIMRLQPRKLLDLGSGTGEGTRVLRQRYPDSELIALDLALGMLQQGRTKLSSWKDRLPWNKPSVRHVCADADALPLKSDSLDMIWSNVTLQWCNNLEKTFGEFYRALNPGGLLFFSTFGPDTLKELRSAFAGLDGYPHVSRFVDMHDIGDALSHSGFAAPVMEMECLTLTYADLRSMLRELKDIGAHNAAMGRRSGLMGRGEWQALQQAYEQFRRDGRLPATFEVIYGHAWVPEQKRRQLDDGRQVIQFNIQQRRAKHGI